MRKLYLDDIRSPPDSSWIVVRSHDEFVAWIQTHGTPDEISFDHDLGDGVPTGMDCAKWIVESERPLLRFTVHSANPPGRANILGLLQNWRRHCRQAGIVTNCGYNFIDLAPRGAGPRGRASDDAAVFNVVVGGAASVGPVLASPPTATPQIAIVFGSGEVENAAICVRVADQRAARKACLTLTWLCAMRPAHDNLDASDIVKMIGSGREGFLFQRQGATILEAARSISLAMGGRHLAAACVVLSMHMGKDEMATQQANEALHVLVDDDCDQLLFMMRALPAPGAQPRLAIFGVFR